MAWKINFCQSHIFVGKFLKNPIEKSCKKSLTSFKLPYIFLLCRKINPWIAFYDKKIFHKDYIYMNVQRNLSVFTKKNITLLISLSQTRKLIFWNIYKNTSTHIDLNAFMFEKKKFCTINNSDGIDKVWRVLFCIDRTFPAAKRLNTKQIPIKTNFQYVSRVSSTKPASVILP